MTTTFNKHPMQDRIDEILADHPGRQGMPADTLRELEDAGDTILRDAIDAFIKTADRTLAETHERMGYTGTPETHEATFISDKWCRVARVHGKGTTYEGRSAYAFVALRDNYTKALGQVRRGAVHKPDGWKRAAKHARGNVLGEFAGAVGPYGIARLR